MAEEINHLSDAGAFLDAADGRPDTRDLEDVRVSAYGNLNIQGTPYDLRAPAVPPCCDDFDRFIEPGIRDLVLLLVRRWGLLTYTSCEGHRYPPQAGLGPQLPHVGWIVRSQRDASVTAELAASARSLSPRLEVLRLVAVVRDRALDTDDGPLDAAELALLPLAPILLQHVFEHREEAMRLIVAALEDR